MSDLESNRETIIIKNSPVSFAVMGPGTSHRAVLIRSDDKNMDLVGLDNQTFRSTIMEQSINRPRIFQVLLVPEPCSFIVNTSMDFAQSVSKSDGRRSHFSFAWRGVASNMDVKEIEEIFSRMAADLATALSEKTSASAEWQVAPLVALCRAKTDAYIQRRKDTRAVLILALLVNGLIALGLALDWPYFLHRFNL